MNRQQAVEQRRRHGEADWRNRFNEFGLDEWFEFIKRDWDSHKGRRVLIKCKSCSSVFFTWGLDDVFKGKQSHLLCPHCGAASDGKDVWERSPRCNEAMNFYIQGHSVRETAERFGVSLCQINNSVKRRGLTNGVAWKEAGALSNEKRSEEASRLLAQRIANGEIQLPRGGNIHKRRAIKYGCEYDSSVTLKKLIKRDGLRCVICGEMCNPNATGWSEHFGPTSPTIDHIIPMAKGGGHVWNNVQVAHAICNIYKSDNTEEAV